MSNGEHARLQGGCHIKCLYFDEEYKARPKNEIQSYDRIGRDGGHEEEPRIKFVDLKHARRRKWRRSCSSEVCDSEGCLEMTLPGGRCFDIGVQIAHPAETSES